MDPALYDLVKSGGAVLIATVVLAVLIYLGYRYIIVPSQRQTRAIAASNEEAARQHALAAKSHENASQANAETSRANAETSGHLRELTKMLIQAALK